MSTERTDETKRPPSVVRARIRRRRRASITLWGGLALFALAPFLFAALGDAAEGALWLGGLSLLLSLIFRTLNPEIDGVLATEPDAITLTPARGAARRFRFDSIRRARLFPEGSKRRIEWAMANGDVLELHIPHADDAAALFRAAGLDARHHRYEASLGLRSHRIFGGVFTFAMSAWGVAGLLAPLFIRFPDAPILVVLSSIIGGATLITTGLLSVFRPPHVTVGADGLDLRVSVWRYFIPYRSLASVRLADDHLLVFTYRDGRARTLYASVPRAESEALSLRVEEAMRIFAVRGSSGDAGVLDRAGRKMDPWRSVLRALLAGSRSYRESHLDRDALIRVLEDTDAPAERRIGAALALSETAGGPVERVRAAARICASEPLRVALERAAETTLDDATVDAAVAHERNQRVL